MRHLILWAASVAALMLSIYVFAPQSQNKVLRAVVVVSFFLDGVALKLEDRVMDRAPVTDQV